MVVLGQALYVSRGPIVVLLAGGHGAGDVPGSVEFLKRSALPTLSW